MKRWMIGLCAAALVIGARGQGFVNFQNSSATLISFTASWLNPPSGLLPANEPGSYQFALMTAPYGDNNLAHFQFTGIYATNTAAAGRINGGSNIMVPGWRAGEVRNFLVVGWPTSIGYDFNFVFNGQPPSAYPGYCSSIGTGAAGGFDGIGSLPVLSIFGSSPSIGGFVVQRIPEPGSAALLLAGSALFLARRRSR